MVDASDVADGRFVVVGRTAKAVALGEEESPDGPCYVSVPTEEKQRLLGLGWSPVDGGGITDGRVVATVGWRGASHEELAARAWPMRGMAVASLPDTYARMQDSRVDGAQAEEILRLLQDPGRDPLPLETLDRERRVIEAALAEHLTDEEWNATTTRMAIHLAANGMHIVRTLYGDPDVGLINRIIGRLEQAGYGVRAVYHNGMGLDEAVVSILRHCALAGDSTQEMLRAVVAEVYSDAVYGNGRRSDARGRPEALESVLDYDELLSAELVKAHAAALGFPVEEAEAMHRAVLGTAFDEATGRQLGESAREPAIQATAGEDLLTLASAEGMIGGLDIGMEDLMSRRAATFQQVFALVLAEHGETFRTSEGGLRLVEAHWDHRPPGWDESTDTVGEAFVKRLRGNGKFTLGYRFPPDYTMDNQDVRRLSAAAYEDLADRLELPADEPGAITARELPSLVTEHAQRMSRRQAAVAGLRTGGAETDVDDVAGGLVLITAEPVVEHEGSRMICRDAVETVRQHVTGAIAGGIEVEQAVREAVMWAEVRSSALAGTFSDSIPKPGCTVSVAVRVGGRVTARVGNGVVWGLDPDNRPYPLIDASTAGGRMRVVTVEYPERDTMLLATSALRAVPDNDLSARIGEHLGDARETAYAMLRHARRETTHHDMAAAISAPPAEPSRRRQAR